jgi:hypothetical protein
VSYVVEPTPEGARVVVDGVVRATFVGDLDDPAQHAAFDEMLQELFERPGGDPPGRATRATRR